MTYSLKTINDSFDNFQLSDHEAMSTEDILVNTPYSTQDGTQLHEPSYYLRNECYPYVPGSAISGDTAFVPSLDSSPTKPSLKLNVTASYGHPVKEDLGRPDGYLTISLFNSLESSSYSNCTPINNKSDMRGFYLRRLLVNISVSYPDGNIIDNMCGPSISTNSPATIEEGGSATSESGWSATGTAGEFNMGALGVSNSNSVTRQYGDFSLTNLSRDSVLSHLWQLNYDPTTGKSGPFDGINIPGAPTNAWSEFSLIDQANWQVPYDKVKALGGTLNIKIAIGVMVEHIQGTKVMGVYWYVCDRTMFQWGWSRTLQLPPPPTS